MISQTQEAAQVLRRGGIIIFPTTAVYSLGANIFNQKALQKVVDLKDSSLPEPLPIIVSKFRLAENLAYIGGNDLAILRQLWPGPTTVLLPRKASLFPELVDSQDKIALQFSDDIAAQIIQETGFMITSLPAFSQAGFPIVRPEEIDFSVDLVVKGICQFAKLSTIVDLTDKSIKREGAEVEKVRTILQLKD